MSTAIKDMLASKIGFETVKEARYADNYDLVGRMGDNPVDNLMLVFHQLHVASLDRPWKLDASKVFPLSGRKLVSFFRFSFSGVTEESLAEILEIIRRCPKAASKRVTEVALVGNNKGGQRENGKGAVPAGKALVGPMLRASMLRGTR